MDSDGFSVYFHSISTLKIEYFFKREINDFFFYFNFCFLLFSIVNSQTLKSLCVDGKENVQNLYFCHETISLSLRFFEGQNTTQNTKCFNQAKRRLPGFMWFFHSPTITSQLLMDFDKVNELAKIFFKDFSCLVVSNVHVLFTFNTPNSPLIFQIENRPFVVNDDGFGVEQRVERDDWSVQRRNKIINTRNTKRGMRECTTQYG